ncbi:shikimate dehydrogenase [Tepidibacter aestuarii]|uniref:shikimate dehydrogenase n=1 Tax=Tepidibacter aestuarii TaxID=2925782 RepID=UPI0020BF8BC2|nr:shikimate dehydrogenase [Tepidibacter aestuarii]CAH2213836.1 Shikimate dehydrogenase (NADP(+)) [Tepidibacter aestuarii]
MSSLYGLIGEKLGHSFSSIIHSIIFKELSIDGHYHLFEVNNEHLKDAVFGLNALKARGANVTIPYKVDIIKYLNGMSIESNKIGAVNTICFKDNKTIGYNTDYYGFGIMLNKYNVNVKNKTAVILGTGGASKAVVQYLLDKEINDIVFVSRDISKVDEKFKKFKLISYDEIKHLKQKDIIINCTPCGMHPNVNISPINKEDMSKFKVAVDLIYNPTQTLFLKYAKELGLVSINGLYMLIGQAVKAEELWNNTEIDSAICDKIYYKINSILQGGNNE